MKLMHKLTAALCSGIMLLTAAYPAMPVRVSAAEMAHDPSRNVQEEGVGNPFNFGNVWLPRVLPLPNCASSRTK